MAERLKKIRQTRFTLKFTGTEEFRNSALVVLTDAPKALERLRTAILEAFESEFGDGFEEWKETDFRPHVTVARSCSEGLATESRSESPFMHEEIPASEWQVDRFALWIRK